MAALLLLEMSLTFLRSASGHSPALSPFRDSESRTSLAAMSGITNPRIPFRLKLTLLGAALATIPLAFVGWRVLDANKQAVKANSQEIQLAILGDVARTIEESFADAQDALDALGRVLTDASLDEVSTERLAANILASQARVDHAGVYGPDGTFLDALIEERAQGVELPTRLDDDLIEVASAEGVATGRAELVLDSPRVLVVLPLRVRDQVSGYVATYLSLSALQSRVERLNELRFEGRANSLFVVDNELRLIAHPSARGGFLEPVDEPVLEGIPERVLTENYQQSGEFDRDGDGMVGTVVGLRLVPWALVAQVPQSVAYVSLFRIRRIVLFTLAIVIFLSLIAAFYVARQITQPIKQLADFANDLAARRFDRRVTVETRDELGVLGDVMSAAAAELQGSEERIRKEMAIRSDLGRYLPQELVEKVVAREQDMALGGARRNVTVLFADVVAFTPLTDRLAAEEVVGLLNELFTIMTDIVFRHNGTIDKFIGDCVMAVWGATDADGDHAAEAVAAADDMMRWLEAGNSVWEERFGVRIELAIGINTGDAVVGNIGSESRMEYTVIGDTVNVAARLESIARPSQILITATTANAIDDAFEVRSLGMRKLNGRNEELELFEVSP